MEQKAYIRVNVDDCMLIGDPEACEKAVQEIFKRFSIMVDRKAKDFIGCKFICIPSKTRLWVSRRS